MLSIINKAKRAITQMVQLGGTIDSSGNPAGNVVISNPNTLGQAHNRYITGVAETEASLGHITWTEAENVRAVRFRLDVGAGTPSVGDFVRVVFDATPVDDTSNTAQAWAYLQDPTASESVDVEFHELTYVDQSAQTDADAGWSRWFEFAAPLRRADFHFPNGTAAASAEILSIMAEVG